MALSFINLGIRKISGTFFAFLYIVFGLTDLLLSLAAFTLGVYEGNPLLAWFLEQGLFVYAKVGLTVFVALLIWYLYAVARARAAIYIALGITALVDIYHIWALRVLLMPTG